MIFHSIAGLIFDGLEFIILDPKGVALYRASENLKHIMAAKKRLGKKITDSL